MPLVCHNVAINNVDVVDPYWQNVELLLKGETGNGSTSIIDSSPRPKTANTVSNVTVSTTQYKWGTGSIYHASSATNSWIAYTASNWTNFSNQWTIECWFILPAGFNNGNLELTEVLVGSAGPNITCYNSGEFNVYSGPGGSAYYSTQTSLTTAGVWHHMAMCKTSGNNTPTLFIDGIQLTNIQQVTSSGWTNGNGVFYQGRADGGSKTQVYVDDFRITQGIVRYTANFPTPSKTFPTG